MSYALRAEFAGFRRFLTLRFFGAQSEPVAEATAAKYADHMRWVDEGGGRARGGAWHTHPTSRATPSLMACCQPSRSAPPTSRPARSGLLGFVHRERGVPLDLLTFAHAFPSSAREGVAVVSRLLVLFLWGQACAPAGAAAPL